MRRNLVRAAVIVLAGAIVSGGAFAQQDEGIVVTATRVPEAKVVKPKPGSIMEKVSLTYGVGYNDLDLTTDKGKDELVGAMNSEEESSRWMKIIFSVILWTIAFNLMLGPAMLMFNLFPVKQVGGCARGIVTVFAFIAACFTTWITYVLTRFWWVVVLLIVALAVFMIVRAMTPGKAEPDMDLDDKSGPDDTPEAGPEQA